MKEKLQIDIECVFHFNLTLLLSCVILFKSFTIKEFFNAISILFNIDFQILFRSKVIFIFIIFLTFYIIHSFFCTFVRANIQRIIDKYQHVWCVKQKLLFTVDTFQFFFLVLNVIKHCRLKYFSFLPQYLWDH